MVSLVRTVRAQIHAGPHVRYPGSREIEGHPVCLNFTVETRRTSQYNLWKVLPEELSLNAQLLQRRFPDESHSLVQ